MLDFTSALYLGMGHPSWALCSWDRLTAGAPAALRESIAARGAAAALACLIGTEAGTLLPSTLHAFWDLFGTLPPQRVAVYVDAGTYPVGRWGVERAAARTASVRSFRHHDAATLERAISSGTHSRARPVVVTDGWCPGCGGPAPIGGYLEVVRRHGGLLVLDDTQALGILGAGPSAHSPFGLGGGGSLLWHGLVSSPRFGARPAPRVSPETRWTPPHDVVVIASLAKGFGAPVAVVAGGRDFLSAYEEKSEVRTHSSPVSMAHVRAAEHGMDVNDERGEPLRRRLAQTVAAFQASANSHGVPLSGGVFPVQSFIPPRGIDPTKLRDGMLRLGIRTVVVRSACQPRPSLTFLITTLHTSEHVEAAAAALARSLASTRLRPTFQHVGRWTMQPTSIRPRSLR